MASVYRYAAFISYSSRDEAFARRLIRALESYRIPKSLGRFALTDDPRAINRLYPCFRDREELGSGDLGRAIERALADSSVLVVVCSPDAARSEWVDKEIRYFANLGRGDRIFAVIASGQPNASEVGALEQECFPPALRARNTSDAAIKEVVAGDARQQGDGFRNAWLKVVAGAADINLGKLLDRDRAARRQRSVNIGAAVLGASLAIAVSIGWTNRAAEQIVFREQAVLAAEAFPAQQARLLLAAARGQTDILPSASGVEAALAALPAGTVELHPFELQQASMSPDGRRLVVWGPRRTDDANREARLIDLASMATLANFETSQVLFSPGSNRLVTIAQGHSAVLLNSEDGSLVANLGDAMDGVLFSPDGRRLVVGAEDATLIDAETGRRLADLGALYPEFAGAQFAGNRMLLQDLDERWTWRSADDGRVLAQLGKPGSIATAPDGSRFVTIASAQEFQFGNAVLHDQNGRAIRDLGPHLKVVFSPDSATFAAYELGATLRSSADGSDLVRLDGDDIAFSPDGSRAVVWSSLGETTGRLVNTRDGKVVADLPEMANDPTDLDVGMIFGGARFSPDGERLMTAFRGRSMLRDGRSGAMVREDVYHSELMYSPDSRWVLVSDTNARLLNRDGAPVFETSGVVVTFGDQFSFSTNGRFLLMPEGLGMVLMDLDRRTEERWPRRREEICALNRDAIGPFTEVDRGAYATSELRSRLRGRPWHPCDWRGLYSAEGWAQLARYWSVRLGLPLDYQADECDRARRGLGCPAAANIARR